MFKKNLSFFSLLFIVIFLFSCAPYSKKEILCDYKDFNCLYYTKDNYKEYKYRDYIVDDISTGAYKKSSPSLADYKNGPGPIDYDIPAYVNAKMDYAIKTELIKKYEYKIDDLCSEIYDGCFKQRQSYIYFFDKGSGKSKLLSEKLATNISYDDEVPNVSFDIVNEKEISDRLLNRKIMLSDIIASNTTIEGFMKVILSYGKERKKFFMGDEIELNENMPIISTNSITKY